MSKKILIVDDSPLIHKLMGRALEAGGYKVCGNAKNGQEAVALFEAEQPDCVFMDVTMPIMNGLDAARAIKANHPTSKIVMLTAMGDDEMIAEATAAGVDVFLKKPFKDQNVMEALEKILR